MSKWLNRILWVLFVALVICQTVVAALYTMPVPECRMGLADVSYLKLLAGLFKTSPARIAFDILPFVIIPLSYLSYAFLAKSLSEGPVKTPAILIFIELLNIYGFQSETLSPYSLLLGYYRGGAILLHVILPFVLAEYIRWRDKHPRKEKVVVQEDSEDDLEDEMKHKILNVRNLSIAFIAFVIIAVGALFVLNRKINNLHQATVNLQNVIESKGEFIEFKGALGDTFRGYIVVDADKNVTVIFGGRYEDGEALMQVLSEYGNHVTSWYLEDEGEQGAFEYCRENGTEIDHIYTIEGIEEL